jgi:hypothetical protein
VLRTVGARVARELDALRGFNDECVGFVATRLRRAVFAPGEVVYAPGRAADEMYFVANGAVRLIPAGGGGGGGGGEGDPDAIDGLGPAAGSSQSLGLGGDPLAVATVADATAAAGQTVEVRTVRRGLERHKGFKAVKGSYGACKEARKGYLSLSEA